MNDKEIHNLSLLFAQTVHGDDTVAYHAAKDVLTWLGRSHRIVRKSWLEAVRRNEVYGKRDIERREEAEYLFSVLFPETVFPEITKEDEPC